MVGKMLSGNRGALPARYEVMLDVTLQTLRSDPDLRLCEGLRLIEATRTAVARHAPERLDAFEARVVPELRQALFERFGMVDNPLSDIQ
jgi:hypothetical protein